MPCEAKSERVCVNEYAWGRRRRQICVVDRHSLYSSRWHGLLLSGPASPVLCFSDAIRLWVSGLSLQYRPPSASTESSPLNIEIQQKPFNSKQLGLSSPKQLGPSSPKQLGLSSPKQLGLSSPKQLGPSSPKQLGISSYDEPLTRPP